MNDYDRIAKALAFLEGSIDDQPDLDRVAAEIGPLVDAQTRGWLDAATAKIA